MDRQTEETRAKEILAAYQACRVAVAYTEVIICGPDPDGSDDPCAWDITMSAQPPMPLEHVLECIQHAMAGETKCNAEQALRETYLPEYRKYLAGKMGLV